MTAQTRRRIATRALENTSVFPYGLVRRPARSAPPPVGPALSQDPPSHAVTRAAVRTLPRVDNAAIADRLDAFASLLELAEANPYTARAYRRAAELIRGTAAPVDTLVLAGRVRELRGIGPGIEARLRELLETGQIAELAELERELAPGLVGLGRYLGLTARR